MKRHKTVDEFMESVPKEWKGILEELRKILNETDLQETVKWGMPVYTHKGKNIVGIGSFSTYAGIWFYQGATLKDEANKLINAQEGKTHAMRQWRFSSKEEIDKALIQSYVAEAMRNQEAGRVIKPKKKPLVIPHELQKVLNEKKELSEAFESLSLTKKREFTEYIESAKREETKTKRLEKIIPMISKGIGLNDKYR